MSDQLVYYAMFEVKAQLVVSTNALLVGRGQRAASGMGQQLP